MESKEAASAETSLIEIFEDNDKINIRCLPEYNNLDLKTKAIIIDNLFNALLRKLEKFPLVSICENMKSEDTVDILFHNMINELPNGLLIDYINKCITGLETYRDLVNAKEERMLQ